MTYQPSAKHYDARLYRSCGKIGLKLPVVPLGLWHNFGDATPMATQRARLRTVSIWPSSCGNAPPANRGRLE